MFVTEKVLSDPTLQRFFSLHSLVDAFKLGGEYAERVAEGCHGTLVQNTISLLPSVKGELAQGATDVLDRDGFARPSAAATVSAASGARGGDDVAGGMRASRARVIDDPHADSAPRRSQMPFRDGSSARPGGAAVTGAPDADAETGLIAALVDNTGAADGLVQRAAQSSETARRLAQLSALSRLRAVVSGGSARGGSSTQARSR
jgi:hypothetical protein